MHVLRIYVSLSINLKTMKLSTYKVYNNPYETFLPKMLNLNQIKPFKLKYAQRTLFAKKLVKHINYTMFMASHICTQNI